MHFECKRVQSEKELAIRGPKGGKSNVLRTGRLPLFGALVLFILFFGNVALGAAGGQAPLGDVAEMLTLLASSLLFVIGVLEREAVARNPNKQD